MRLFHTILAVILACIASLAQDETVAVHFAYEPGSEGCLALVKVDGVEASEFADNNLSIPAGSTLTLIADTNRFANIQMTLNGQSEDFYDGWSSMIYQETTFGFSAKAKEVETVSISVDNGDAVEAYFASGVQLPLQSGYNATALSHGASLMFKATEGYWITDVSVRAEGSEEVETLDASLFQSYYVYDSAYGECSLSVSTISIEEARTAKASVTVDHADMVGLHLAGGEQTLEDGANEIIFSPAYESDFVIYPTTDAEIYRVRRNGRTLWPNQGSSTFALANVANAEAIIITVDFPEGEAKVNLEYLDEASEFMEAKFLVNGIDVIDFNDDKQRSFMAPYGSHVTMNVDLNQGVIDKLTHDGVSIKDSFRGSYTFTMRANSQLAMRAHQFQDFNLTVYVDQADIVDAFLLDAEAGEQIAIPLADGENLVEVSEAQGSVYVKSNHPNYEIIDFTVNGRSVEKDIPTDCFIFTPAQEQVVNISTAKIERQYHAMAYVNMGQYQYISILGQQNMFPVYTSQGVQPASGYYPIDFDDEHNPFAITVAPLEKVRIYLNNALLESELEDLYRIEECSLAQGDVIKIYYGDPSSCEVMFTDANEFAAVTVDHINAQTTGLTTTVLPGTEFSIKALPGKSIEVVTLDGIEVVPSDGIYTVNVWAPKHRVAIKENTSGIADNVAADSNAARKVCDILGRVLFENASDAELESLARGVYIVNGQKIIKR